MPLFRFAADTAAELLDDEPPEIEPQARAVGLERRHVVRPVELLEEVPLALLGNADAGVLDLPAHQTPLAHETDVDRAPARRALDRVRDEVEHDLAQELRIGEHVERILA